MGRVSQQSPWGVNVLGELTALVEASSPNVARIQDILNRYTFPPATLIQLAEKALTEDNLNLSVLFNKIPANDMLLVLSNIQINSTEHEELIRYQVLGRGATPNASHLLKLYNGGEFDMFTWLVEFAFAPCLLTTFEEILTGLKEEYEDTDGELDWVRFLVNTYLHRYKGPGPIREMIEVIHDTRGYRALMRYVLTYRERETLFMFTVLAKRNPTTKLPLDLVKRLAAMLLGEKWDRKATQLEIADEGRCEL